MALTRRQVEMIMFILAFIVGWGLMGLYQKL